MAENDDRAARLAQKLRENLRKRKAHARAGRPDRPQPHRESDSDGPPD